MKAFFYSQNTLWIVNWKLETCFSHKFEMNPLWLQYLSLLIVHMISVHISHIIFEPVISRTPSFCASSFLSGWKQAMRKKQVFVKNSKTIQRDWKKKKKLEKFNLPRIWTQICFSVNFWSSPWRMFYTFIQISAHLW